MDVQAGQQQQGQQQPRLEGFFAGHLHFWSFMGLLLIVAAIIGGIAGWNITHPQQQVAVAAELGCIPNATVSWNISEGEGFSRISEAIAAAPDFSSSRYCILIRSGRYEENLVIGPEKTNVVLVGEGVNNTILAAGNRTTLGNATLLVQGEGFIAMNLTVANGHGNVSDSTVVAVENWSDRSIFYHCRLIAHGEVIRMRLSRQFYIDCHIRGGGSSSGYPLIYGRGQAFFQYCWISVDGATRKNVVADQVRRINAAGGFVFHLCRITEYLNKNKNSTPTSSSISTFLGSASTAYTRIAYLESEIDLQGAVGWLTNNFTRGTVFFGEYNNTRFGSSYTSSHLDDDVRELDFTTASQLSLGQFFAEAWIPDDIPHKMDLGGILP